MSPPSLAPLHNALTVLGAATRPDEIDVGAAALTEALGMERYTLINVSGGGLATDCYHNAPPALSDEMTSHQVIGVDPVAMRVRATPIPVIWQPTRGGGGAWRDEHADFGYRSGVAAGCWDPDGSGRIVMLSCSAECITDEQAGMLLRYSLVAATTVTVPMQKMAALRRAACPLTERELDCLLYVAAGISAKQIARALGISVRTVTQYLERARAKLQAKNSRAAATLAMRNGWLDMQKALDLAAA